ncbi:DUF4279 domain-containing protein [Actinomadura violacea]|uniref:DUF4279 domain-containing protein n=1 Tax=Actinomadura violacea TaxID=2819934 RepID=A0ABS3S6R1_9ACTN|nr:DUF4279 domain-containing protein [Actinomadura violacea]MBO2464697.1 DUF4279 domain-containing protein [Actinomadura violacea]
MPVRQYVYFALFSRHVTAHEMTAVLRIAPDEVSVRGSRFTTPTEVPVSHAWEIVCREPGLCVDEQITRVLDRLRPHADRVAGLAARLAADDEEHGGAVLQVVRYFEDADPGSEEQALGSPAPQEPNLFGWHLDGPTLAFLVELGAELDVDEYDLISQDDNP